MPANIDKAKIKVDYSVLRNKADMIAKSEELKNLGNTFYAEMGDDLDKPTKEQLEYITDLNKAAEELDEKIKLSDEFKEQTRRREEFYGGNRGGAPGAPPYSANPNAAKTLGSAFVESKEFQRFVEEKRGGLEHISDNVSVEGMVPVVVDTKALITGASPTSAGAFVRRDYDVPVGLGWPTLGMADLISIQNTGSDVIEYARQVSRVNRAAITREATSSADGQTPTVAGLKPESEMAFEKVTANVKNIAHMIAITRRALSDVPQMQGIVDDELMIGIDQAVENELINGDGTEDHLLGLANTPGMGAQPFTADLKSPTNLALGRLRTLRMARTKVEQVGFDIPTAYLMNPYDWEDIELSVDGQDRYYYGGPGTLAVPRLWGLPVVTSPFLVRGTSYVGNFKRIVLWNREEIQMRITDAHKDWFQRNLIALLAERRLASGNKKPIAIYSVDTVQGPNS